VTSQIITEQLPNGLTLAVEPMPHLRSVSWTLLIEAGSAGDPEGANGAAQLLSGMVYRGAGGRDARELSDALDTLGIQRRGRLDHEYVTLGGSSLGVELGPALQLYADIARRPALPAAELDAERALALQALASLHDNPSQRLFVQLTQAYFPGSFGRPTLGAAEDLQRIDIGDLQTEHSARFKPGGAILSIAGGVSFAEARQLVLEHFGDWQGTPRPTPPATPRGDTWYEHLQQETSQTQIGLVFEGLPIEHPDYYKARLGLNVLSGGMATRLFTEVREKRGLVYTVMAVPRFYRGAGLVLGYAGTQPERAQETMDVLAGEIRRLSEGVTAEELQRARTGLLTSLVMQGESTAARAAAMAGDLFLIGRARTLDEIRDAVAAVTLEAINAYLASTPAPRFTVLTLGPEPITPPA
jgi:predicted Zn-dependent peptidase